jgi:NAD(P)-dependent dehydrogenase (short-subunit alcohol dehydrogenase family)
MYDVVITGSSGLIGSALSKHFIEMGYQVACLDIDQGNDLSDEKFVKTWFSHNSSKSLVNTFGLNDHVFEGQKKDSFFNLSLSHFSNVLNVNLTSLFSVCRQYILNNNSGSIVNFSSIYGVISPDPTMYEGSEKDISYGVSKAGVLQLSRHLAVHAAPHFRVNSIVLGGVRNNQDAEFIRKYSEKTPLKRMGEVNDIFSLVKYLISSDSEYCTGSTFTLDGGWTAL